MCVRVYCVVGCESGRRHRFSFSRWGLNPFSRAAAPHTHSDTKAMMPRATHRTPYDRQTGRGDHASRNGPRSHQRCRRSASCERADKWRCGVDGACNRVVRVSFLFLVEVRCVDALCHSGCAL